MRERVAALTALLIVIGAIVAGVILRASRGPRTPEDAVYTVFQASRDGDSDAYLSHFSGELRTRLEASRTEAGLEAFSSGIQQRALAMTGLAITHPYPDKDSDTDRILRVELVFRDRNERQDFHMVKAWTGWTICEISSSDSVTMPIPYGTPVMPDPPADNPQPGTR